MFRKETLRRNALPLALGGGALLLMMLFLGIGTLAVVAGQNRAGEDPSSQNRSSQNQSPLGAGPDVSPPSPDRMSAADEQPSGTASPPPNASGYIPPGYSVPDAGGEAVTSGYWDRQRSQDQRAQAFSNSIRDTNTVQDMGNGEVSTVTNTEADTAIARGEAAEVPTSQLPTRYDSGSAIASTESSASPPSSAGTGE